MKFGIFGGTFNPIHFGHLRAAEEVREKLNLKKIIFIPCGIPPHRPSTNLAPFPHRYQMVRIAIANNPYFIASEIEGKRPGKSYSVDTLKLLLQKQKKGLFYFIIGLDAFLTIETWKDPLTLFKLTHFVIIPRKNLAKKQILHTLKKFFPHVRTNISENTFYLPHSKIIYYPPITLLNISATQIRSFIAEDKSVRYLIPARVENYIYKYALYKEGNEKRNKS